VLAPNAKPRQRKVTRFAISAHTKLTVGDSQPCQRSMADRMISMRHVRETQQEAQNVRPGSCWTKVHTEVMRAALVPENSELYVTQAASLNHEMWSESASIATQPR